jgi:hypothetical protein
VNGGIIEGLMILLQDTTGKPVVPPRFRNGIDDPHFAPGPGELIFPVMRSLEPRVSIGRLARIAEKVRRKWGGRRMTFEHFFPGYGLSTRLDGSLVSLSGLVIERIEPNLPTYFHPQASI